MTSQLAQWLTGQGFGTQGVNSADADGLTPLLRAASKADVQILCEIIAEGGDLDAKTRDGDNAISLAAARRRDQLRVEGLLGT